MDKNKKGSEQVITALEEFIIRVTSPGSAYEEEMKVLPEIAKIYFEAIKISSLTNIFKNVNTVNPEKILSGQRKLLDQLAKQL